MAFTSDKRLYLDKDGKVVEEGDPTAATLLVGEGGTLSDEDAATYGLTGSAPATADAPNGESKAVTTPKANKSQAPDSGLSITTDTKADV